MEELEGLLATLRSQAGVAAGTLVNDRTKQESLQARVRLLPDPAVVHRFDTTGRVGGRVGGQQSRTVAQASRG